jgi:hypothetical protein
MSTPQVFSGPRPVQTLPSGCSVGDLVYTPDLQVYACVGAKTWQQVDTEGIPLVARTLNCPATAQDIDSLKILILHESAIARADARANFLGLVGANGALFAGLVVVMLWQRLWRKR